MLLRNITIGNEIIPSYLFENVERAVPEILKLSNCDKYILIYDTKLHYTIDRLYMLMMKHTSVTLLPMKIQEAVKNLDTLSKLISKLLSMGVDRNTCLVAIGGGVLENTVGMAAGLLYRGISLIHIPTTLMACADSTVSLKQAINFERSKNIVGLYYAPKGVFTIYSIIQNLPPEEVSAGYVEFVKNLLTLIPEKIPEFELCNFNRSHLEYENLKTFINDSIDAKELVIQNDPKEKKEGLILEYGHTIGHALEVLSSGTIRHGEGVAIGMLVCSDLSYNVFNMPKSDVEYHWNLIKQIGIFSSLKSQIQFLHDLSIEQLIECVFNDNKRGRIISAENEIPMVLLDSIGHVHIENDCCVYPIDYHLVKNSLRIVISKILEILNNQEG